MRNPECIASLRFSDSVIPAQAGIQIEILVSACLGILSDRSFRSRHLRRSAVALNSVDADTYMQGVCVLLCVMFCIHV
jgi:hypothetical protein